MLRPDWLLILTVSRWGSRMSRYLETMRTEMKYTTAKARNWACLLSSCKEVSQKCHFVFRICILTLLTVSYIQSMKVTASKVNILNIFLNLLRMHVDCSMLWIPSLLTCRVKSSFHTHYLTFVTNTCLDSPRHETPQHGVD